MVVAEGAADSVAVVASKCGVGRLLYKHGLIFAVP